MNALLRLVCAGTFLLAACGDEPSPTPDTDASTVDITSDLAVDDDGGVDITVDVSLIEDAPVDVPDLVADLGPEDSTEDTPLDVAGLPCGAACTSNEVCFGAICVQECTDGPSVDELSLALPPGTVIVSNFCTATTHTEAFALLPTWEALELVATPQETQTEFRLRRWPLYQKNGPALAEDLIVSAVDGLVDTWEVLPAGFLSLSASHALWGYATINSVLGGKVFRTSLDAASLTTTFSAPGIAGGALIESDKLLTFSFGLNELSAGVGVYAEGPTSGQVSLIMTDLGDTSGELLRVGNHLLISAYSDAWTSCDDGEGGEEPLAPAAGRRTFVIPQSAVGTSIEKQSPLQARCDVTQLALEDEFEAFGDEWLLRPQSDGAFGLSKLRIQALEVNPDSGELSLGPALPLTLDATFIRARKMPGAGLVLLEHDAGYLLVKVDALDPADDVDDDEGDR